MFVKWSCGCRGFLFDDACWVIDSCDKDDTSDAFHLYERDMTQGGLTEGEQDKRVAKSFESLPPSEARLLLTEIGRLMSDGYAFRQMQSLFAHTWGPIEAAGDGPNLTEDDKRSC